MVKRSNPFISAHFISFLMSYTPLWSSEAAIEKQLQIEITESTHPSTTDVNAWLEEVETDMLRQGLGTQTAVSGTMLTVAPVGGMSKDTVGWWLAGLPYGESGNVVVPPYTPIISVTSGAFYRNRASLTSAPEWDILICQDNLPAASDTDFLIVKQFNYKSGNYDGMAFYFFHDLPWAGQRKLSGGWIYGHNINTKILREYATLQASKKVILAKLMAGEPVGLATYRGPDLEDFMNTQTEVLMRYIDTRLEEIAEKHFPKDIAIAVLQGI